MRCQSSYSLIHYLPKHLILQLCLGWELWGQGLSTGGLVQDTIDLMIVPMWYCCLLVAVSSPANLGRRLE